VPCSVEYIPQFPIPLQALIAFILIALSMGLLAREARQRGYPSPSRTALTLKPRRSSGG
jgi:hypothetical protein